MTASRIPSPALLLQLIKITITIFLLLFKSIKHSFNENKLILWCLKKINNSQFLCDGDVASRDVSLRVYFLGTTRAISPTLSCTTRCSLRRPLKTSYIFLIKILSLFTKDVIWTLDTACCIVLFLQRIPFRRIPFRQVPFHPILFRRIAFRRILFRRITFRRILFLKHCQIWLCCHKLEWSSGHHFLENGSTPS